jgi:glycosyltransferase involved in cell wall biosynthesis
MSAAAILGVESSALNILFVSPGVYPPDFGGGQLRVHKTLVRLRDRFPLTVRVLARSGASQNAGESASDGIPVSRLSDSMGSLQMFAAIGRHMFRARRDGAQLVYVLGVSRAIYAVAFWARLLGLPLVTEFMNRNLDEKRARRLMARALVKTARLVIAISQPLAEDLKALGVPAAHLWVRPNPVNVELYIVPSAELRTRLRAEFGYEGEAPLHLMAGTISPRKNHLFVVEAFERLPEDHELLIVGPVLPQNTAFAARLRERIACSPASNRIQFRSGFVDDMHRYMQAADCLWMPSLEEGLGNVMLEALCCGVPCVINRDLGLDEHVTDGVNGWNAALEPSAWAERVLALLPLAADRCRRAVIGGEARVRYDALAFDLAFYRRMADVAGSGWTKPGHAEAACHRPDEPS